MNNLLKRIIYFLTKCHIINDITIAKLKYFYKFHKRLNLKNPQNINEKINWLKFYGNTSKWTDLADKYKVREYVKERGFDNTLVKLYGKWNTLEQIDLDRLPNEFVMKSNNGCGDILICKDKSKLSKTEVINHFKSSFGKVYGLESAEPHYAQIEPCIIAEELLNNDKQVIKSNSLVDYKLYCFNGRPYYIFIVANRNSNNAEIALYDTNWQDITNRLVPSNHYSIFKREVSKPKTLGTMLNIAQKLSANFPIVRVDLYEVDGKVYFGELTFTPLGGFLDNFDEDMLNLMGSKIDLNYGCE